MKKIVFLMSYIFIVGFVSAQDLHFKDVFELTKTGDYNSYTSKDGIILNVGDTIQICKPTFGTSYSFIYFKQMLDKTYVSNTFLGDVHKINKISFSGGNTDKYEVIIKTTDIKAIEKNKLNIYIVVEKALQSGEISIFKQ